MFHIATVTRTWHLKLMFQQLSITHCCAGDAGTVPVRHAALPDTFPWGWDASRETQLGFSEHSPAVLPGWERSSALCVGVRDVVMGIPRDGPCSMVLL